MSLNSRKFWLHVAIPPRTIDSKVGSLRALLNFAIKQGKIHGKNPAERLNLLTKKQKSSGGFGIFDRDEIIRIFDSEYFREQKARTQTTTGELCWH